MSKPSDGEYVLGCVLIFIMIPLGIFMRGWALTMMWGWFVVPFGVMQISMPHALGLSGCIALFHGISTASTKNKSGEDDSPAVTVGKVFAMTLIVPLVIVGVGYIFHYFM
jgi:hypothetical protein